MRNRFRTVSAIPALLLLACSASAIMAADPFTKITSDPIVSSGGSTSLAWGDFNNDGFIDLYVNVINGATSLLYSNNGNGTFTRILTGSVATQVGTCFGAAWADYDNDGLLDLFAAVSGGQNDWLYHNDGNGAFTKIVSGPVVSSGGNGNNCSWGDYDNDGFIDLFVANSDQSDFLYHNNGDGTFTRIMTGAIAQKPGNSQGGTWGDYDNDGRLDLFVSRATVPNLLYHNEGNGLFTSVTNGLIVNEPVTGQGTSWGDYDNDGYLDLFVGNPAAPNFLYHNNGDGTFAKVTNGVVAGDANGLGCGWADYDNDGYLDLFVCNRFGRNYLYHNNGDGTFSRVSDSIVTSDPSASFSSGWADYNNDGFPDLFVSNASAYNNALYLNNGNSNAWITFHCEGRMSNRAAIGTKVRVKANVGGKVLWQLREISGGGGLGSQNDLRPQFGLGDATNVDLARIEWPSGLVQEFTDLTVRQFVTLVEPELTISPATQQVGAGSTATFTAHSTFPTSFTYQWRFNGTIIPGETNISLVVSNVQNGQIGTYSVTTSDPSTVASFTSRPGTLTGPIKIIQQPANRTLRAGATLNLPVVVSGFAPAYQWLFNGTNIPAGTHATLVLTNIQLVQDGNYSVIVSNGFGAVTSAIARVRVIASPVFTQPLPAQTSVVAGDDLTFAVTVVGTPPPFTFQWKHGATVITNIVLNASNCAFTLHNLQSADAGPYSVTVTNSITIGAGASSSTTLSVLADSDGDHLPDYWELLYGFSPTEWTDPNADPDGDGMSNLQEYGAGTDPIDSQSYLKIDSIIRTNAQVILQFFAVSNKTYTVQFRGADQGLVWDRLANVPGNATNRSIQITDPGPLGSNASRFYRLLTPMIP